MMLDVVAPLFRVSTSDDVTKLNNSYATFHTS